MLQTSDAAVFRYVVFGMRNHTWPRPQMLEKTSLHIQSTSTLRGGPSAKRTDGPSAQRETVFHMVYKILEYFPTGFSHIQPSLKSHFHFIFFFLWNF